MSDAAAEIGDPQVRNRGTLGGSLAHADPAADLPAPMLALNAQIEVVGPSGRRTIAADDFFRDIFTTALGDDELIESIRFAPAPASGYARLHQRASRFALVGVAAALELDGGVCRSARVAVTGLTSHATRLPAVEAALVGSRLDAATIASAAAHAAEGADEVNVDIHGSAEYRRQMAEVFARRAIAAAAARA